MRETLDDIAGHADDPVRVAQRLARPERPRRFYETAGVAETEGGYTVTLDGRPTRTPGRTPVRVPAEAIAAAMAAEWAAQGSELDPDTMPMVRLVNSGLELGEGRLPELRAEIVKYAGNDLLLYRADTPRELVAAQNAAWDGVLVAVARHFGVAFQPTIGIIHQPQPPATLDRLGAALDGEGLLPLTAMVSITGLTGSGLLAIALRHHLTDADAAWAAAHVDEDYQIKLWGEVPEATDRRARRRREFDAAMTLLAHIKA